MTLLGTPDRLPARLLASARTCLALTSTTGHRVVQGRTIETMNQAATYLASYDEQLRGEAETPSALDSTWLGPLRVVTFAGGRGFVTYPRLGGPHGAQAREFVPPVLAHYIRDSGITRVEWKSRGHDYTPGLHEALLGHGFTAGEPESIMIGPTQALAVDVTLPAGVRLRTATAGVDLRAMAAMAAEVFGDDDGDQTADALLRRLSRDDGMQLWVAETDDQIISAGRLEPVPGTDFAGIWGGATRPEWRRQGIYRALTAARARAGLAAGKTLIHSDSTEGSRPILERSGLVKVFSTTTPYEWRR